MLKKNVDDDDDSLSHILGGGIPPNLISMWVENNELTEISLAKHHLGTLESYNYPRALWQTNLPWNVCICKRIILERRRNGIGTNAKGQCLVEKY